MELNIKQFSLLFTWTVVLPFFRSDVASGEMCLIKRGWRLDASLCFAVASRPCSERSRLVTRLSHVTVFSFLSPLPCYIFLSFFLFVPACCLFIYFLLLTVSVSLDTWCFQGGDYLDCILVGGYQYFGGTCSRLLQSDFCLGYGRIMILRSAGYHLPI